MSNLLAEIALRAAKAAVAGLVGLVIFAVATGPFGAAPGVELALLSWLAGAALVLLVETSPI